MGTFVIHWLTVIAFVISLITGIRIAGDAITAPFSKWLSPILMEGDIWTWHFLAGLSLFFLTTAYVVYMVRARLAQRNSPKKLKILNMQAPARLKWGAVNVLLHWLSYGLIVLLTATGVLLYLGYGNWWVYIHSVAAFVGLAYIGVHVLTHFLYGGWRQLLRIFIPTKLNAVAGMKPLPLGAALAAGVAVAAVAAGVDWSSRDGLSITRVTEAPKIDGVLDDAVWKSARSVVVHTQQGANLGGTGESTVEARAVHDGKKVYFAFRWQDPSRSLRRIPVIKKEDGWHVTDSNADRMDVVDFYEDKFSVIFSDVPSLGGAGVTGLGPNPLPGLPKPLNERGFHYTTDGSYVDMWQWKVTRGGALGQVDDHYFGPPYTPNAAEKAGTARYQGGYTNDPGRAFYTYNFKPIIKGHKGPVSLVRLPKDVPAQVAALGKYDLNPDSIDDENGRWYMMEAETEPYTAEADAKIPVGTVLPGVIIAGNYEGDRADVKGFAKWKDGYWTLEVARNLTTGSKYDKDFVPGHPLYMWVAVFDHTQTRHTRHARAIRVDLK